MSCVEWLWGRIVVSLGVCVAGACAQLDAAAPAQAHGVRSAGTQSVEIVPALDCAWQAVTPSPVARFESATCVVDGRVYLIGGFINGALEATRRVDIYDPVLDTWTSGTEFPGVPPTHAGFTTLGTDIWIAGGFAGDNPGPTSDAVWRYNTVNDTWRAMPSLPAPRGSCALVQLGRTLHLFGGVGVDKSVDEPEHWVLDVTALTSGWTAAAPLPEPRNHLGGAAIDGLIYAIGGQYTHGSAPVDTRFLHAFDATANTWQRLADLPEPRSHFEPGTFLWDNKIVICGGRSLITGQSAMADVTIYDPALDEWTEVTPLPKPRNAASVQRVGDTIVMVGGATGAVSPQSDAYRRSMASLFDTPLRFNSGGGSYVDATTGIPVNGVPVWCGDTWFNGGSTFNASSSLDILGTDDDALYRSERTGGSGLPSQFTYEIPLEPGTYRVTLHFAEIYWGVQGPPGAGRRVFDVSLEGERVLDDFDIFAEVGPATAVTHSFEVSVADGALDAHFVSSADRPKISAIELVRLEDEAQPVSLPANFALVASGLKAGSVGAFRVGHVELDDSEALTLARAHHDADAVGGVLLPVRVDDRGEARLALSRPAALSAAQHIEWLLSLRPVFVDARGRTVVGRIESSRRRR